MLWPTSTIRDKFGSHRIGSYVCRNRGQLAAQPRRAAEERIARVVAEEPELVATEDRRLRSQIVFELRPRERVGRQAVHEHDRNLSRLKRLAHVQAVERVAAIGTRKSSSQASVSCDAA